jgi:precorrin-6Y C5,15-methyltransferase (decarboxylating)
MPVTVIGMGLSPADLTRRHLEIVRSADILVGGRRHLAEFEGLASEKWPVGRDLDRLLAAVGSAMGEKSVVVLASGDPLLFGIGTRVIEALGPENVTILPNISSIAAAFARLGMDWHDAALFSVHGRSETAGLLRVLRERNKIAVLTDPVRTPGWLAGLLGEHRITGFSMWVLERLGMEGERIQLFGDVREVGDLTFGEPNLVVLSREHRQDADPVSLHFGMPDNAFRHERGLITKSEIRAVTLSKLMLDRPDLVLWDLGAGSGSVGIEAARFLPGGWVYAVEKRAERIEQIAENRDRFGVGNLTAVAADLPGGMEGLPDPDRVFVGGGGKGLPEILRAAAGRLRGGGVIVVNTVLIQSVSAAVEVLKDLELTTDLIQIQVSVARAMPWGERLGAQNPVWIIQGR